MLKFEITGTIIKDIEVSEKGDFGRITIAATQTTKDGYKEIKEPIFYNGIVGNSEKNQLFTEKKELLKKGTFARVVGTMSFNQDKDSTTIKKIAFKDIKIWDKEQEEFQ